MGTPLELLAARVLSKQAFVSQESPELVGSRQRWRQRGLTLLRRGGVHSTDLNGVDGGVSLHPRGNRYFR